MTLIHVPRPPKNAMDLNRPISSLLKAQIEHLHEAEKRLPLQYRSDIYTNAIRTEGEAASYTRAVTEAIHRAHKEAAIRRERAPGKKRTIAAAVAETPRRRPVRRSKGNNAKKGARRK